jgi:hypothetical protein
MRAQDALRTELQKSESKLRGLMDQAKDQKVREAQVSFDMAGADSNGLLRSNYSN